MTNNCDGGAGLYQGTVLFFNSCLAAAEMEKICCIDNLSLVPTTEQLVDQYVGAAECAVRNIRKDSYTIDFDSYKDFSTTALAKIFPNSEPYTVTGVQQTVDIEFAEGAWKSSATEDTDYQIPYSNADKTPVGVTIVGSVDGALVDGTDFEVVQTSGCLAFDASYAENWLRIKAGTTASNEQNLTVTITYTPKAGNGIRLRASTYAATPTEVIIFAVNKNDNTDIITIRATVFFASTGPILIFDDGKQDVSAKQISMQVQQGTEIDVFGLKNSDNCGETCA